MPERIHSRRCNQTGRVFPRHVFSRFSHPARVRCGLRTEQGLFSPGSRQQVDKNKVSEHVYFDFCYIREKVPANYSRGVRATEVSEYVLKSGLRYARNLLQAGGLPDRICTAHRCNTNELHPDRDLRTGIPVLLFVPDRGLFMAVEKDTGADWQG